jgi:hypothetical protein
MAAARRSLVTRGTGPEVGGGGSGTRPMTKPAARSSATEVTSATAAGVSWSVREAPLATLPSALKPQASRVPSERTVPSGRAV